MFKKVTLIALSCAALSLVVLQAAAADPGTSTRRLARAVPRSRAGSSSCCRETG
jgi:hypothetical protein